ncbi:MAG: DegT/DnrJ/EryC1/StrS family aminotransferase [Spirochaetes bacterium]|nr:DegT/DnrJ/EryC1/StrS family aminotransferase [Spirochaetota bacterium]
MKNIFYFYKGRVALYAILKAFGLKKNEIVIIPAYTCIVAVYPIKHLGLVPNYADIDIETYNSPLKEYIKTYNEICASGKKDKIKAIIIQHTYGNMNNETKDICNWAKKNNLFVIEDCAHININDYGFDKPGSFADASFYSSQWNKPFTTGLGGIAVMNNVKFVNKLKEIHKIALNPGIIESILLMFEYLFYKIFFSPHFFWFFKKILNYLSDRGLLVGSSTEQELKGKYIKDYLKKMGIIQKLLFFLEKKKSKLTYPKRIKLMKCYDRLLTENNIRAFKYTKGSILLRYPIFVKNKNEILQKAEKNKIEIGDWFNCPLHPHGSNVDGLNFNINKYPNSNEASLKVINLPLHNKINIKRAEKIVKFIRLNKL